MEAVMMDYIHAACPQIHIPEELDVGRSKGRKNILLISSHVLDARLSAEPMLANHRSASTRALKDLDRILS